METTITWILVGLVTILAGWLTTLLWRQWFASQKDKGVDLPLPPGSFGWPLVGESLGFVIKGSHFFVERFQKYGRIYKTHFLGNPTVRLAGADLIGPLVHSEPHSLRGVLPASARAAFGKKSLVTATGEDHLRMKKHVMDALSTNRLSDYLPGIQSQIRSHLEDWCHRGVMLGFKACENLMCDVSLEIVLGCSKEHDAHGRVRAAFTCINNNLFSLPWRIPGGGMDKILKSRKIIEDFVQDRLQTKGDKDYASCLDVLMSKYRNTQSNSMESGLSADEVIDNIVSMLFAASGTTAGTMCCSLLLLAQCPDVLVQLEAEMEEAGLLGEDCPKELTYEILQGLEFTRCVIKEVLRMHAPAGGMFRQANKTLEVNGYQIPKDWRIVYSIRDTHKMASVFEEPGEFRPNRWQDPQLLHRLAKKDFGGYLPFGLGAKMCPGRNLALLVLTVFLVDIVKTVKFDVKNTNPKMVYLPVTKPADDLPVTFYRK